MFNILLICTGNTCRSPMAQALLADIWQKGPRKKQLNLISAGVFTFDDMPASAEAIQVMQESNIDISGHRSKQVTEELLASADLILTMTESHRQRILEMFPEYAAVIHTITAYIGHDDEVADPFGRGLAAYYDTLEQLEAIMDQLVDKLEDEM
ncbi:MAG TPA: low molecular weight protein arginine phosphatase [Syntrophomonadaceae bacterium]|nr:low molecular weight protein arginine phosphatase [Syntrophomonadaceae bacterium]